MSEFKKLINIVQDENDYIDLSVNSFNTKIQTSLNKVNNDITSLLNNYTKTGKLQKVNLEFALVNKVQIENILRDSGYYQDVEVLLKSQLGLIDDIIKEYKLFDYTLDFTSLNKEAIKQLIKNSSVVFENIGIQATSQIYNGIYDSLVTDMPLSDAVSNIRNAIDNIKLKQYAGTYANTEYMKFNRSVSGIMSNQTGWNTYQFMGPIDAKLSHDFCLRHVGEIMTRKKIDEYSKQYGFDIFTNGGGWNCRHKWVNVPSDYKVSQREQTMISENLKIAKLKKVA
jgi:hypothetical protein